MTAAGCGGVGCSGQNEMQYAVLADYEPRSASADGA